MSEPTAETREVYESMTTERLRLLRDAFLLDAHQAALEQREAGAAFGEGRIALIDRILEARRLGTQ